MLVVVLGASPSVALGLWAWWARARSSKLEIVDLITEAPASKRSTRTATIDAVVLHQMSLSRGDHLLWYKVTAHFVVASGRSRSSARPTAALVTSSTPALRFRTAGAPTVPTPKPRKPARAVPAGAHMTRAHRPVLSMSGAIASPQT